MIIRPRGYKTFLCSTQLSLKFFLLINVKMPTVVGILTCICGKNNILSLTKHKKAEFLDIFILMSIFKMSCSVELSMKKVL